MTLRHDAAPARQLREMLWSEGERTYHPIYAHTRRLIQLGYVAEGTDLGAMCEVYLTDKGRAAARASAATGAGIAHKLELKRKAIREKQ